MYFYICIIPVLVLSCFVLTRFWAYRKHDKILFRFCKLRRELLKNLRTEYTTMPKKNYLLLRDLLNSINTTIHNYEDYKCHFNLNIKKHLKEFKISTEEIESKLESAPKEIKGYYYEAGYVVFLGFITYTPFLRSRVILSILLFLASLIAKIPIASLNAILNYLSWLEKELPKFEKYRYEKIRPNYIGSFF